MPFRRLNHPELELGEVWLINDTRGHFRFIDYATKRRGLIAYDEADKPIRRVYPVFVSAVEFNDRQETVDPILAAFDRAIAASTPGGDGSAPVGRAIAAASPPLAAKIAEAGGR